MAGGRAAAPRGAAVQQQELAQEEEAAVLPAGGREWVEEAVGVAVGEATVGQGGATRA